MKAILVSALALLTGLFLPACSHNTFQSGADRVVLAGLGNKTKAGSITVGAVRITNWEENNAESFQAVLTIVQKMWRNYMIAAGIKYIGGKYFDYRDNKLDSGRTVELEKLRNAKSVTDAEAAQKQLDSKLAAEAEAGASEAAAAPLTPTTPAPAL